MSFSNYTENKQFMFINVTVRSGIVVYVYGKISRKKLNPELFNQLFITLLIR